MARDRVTDWGGKLATLGQNALQADPMRRWRAQLRSAVLLGQIRHESARLPRFDFDEAEVARALHLARLAELTRSPRERRRDPGQLTELAETYGDLAARAAPGSGQRLLLLAQAASMWSLAGYQANSVVVANTLNAELDSPGPGSGDPAAPSEPVDPVAPEDVAPLGLARIVAAILRRDVREVARLGAVALEEVQPVGAQLTEQAGAAPLDLADAAGLAAYGLVGRAAQAAARFWQFGVSQAAEAALRDVETACTVLLEAGVVDTWVLADNLRYVLEDIFAASPWRQLRRAPSWNPLWRQHLRALALDDHPVVQVWPSQRRALDAGLLDPARGTLVATMPTSAGKTHMTEWAILEALLGTPGERLTVFVVPTRALAAETERRLAGTLGRIGLRVSALFGGLEHVEYELRVIATTDVLVATAEKLDLLLRHEPELVERLALVIFDEGHLVADRTRGLRLELLITRLRQRAPAARLLLLSAVLPNFEELGTWLEPGVDGRNALYVPWSPSQLRLGIFQWVGSARGDEQTGVVYYRDEDADHRFFAPFVLVRRRRQTRLFPSERKDVAAALALHYQRQGPVLVGTAKRAEAEAVARAIDAALRRATRAGEEMRLTDPAHDADRERLAAIVAEAAGGDHPLVGWIRQGFGYHHAHLPEQVRVQLERAFRSGTLRILAATSTLSQGVNLPAKTVIVSHTWRNRQTRDRLPRREFWNLAGRAGRAFGETEGHVVLIADDDREAAGLRNFYLDRAAIEPVHSRLLELYRFLVHERLRSLLPLHRLPDGADLGEPIDPSDLGADAPERATLEALDGQLLALAAEEVIDTADEQRIADLLGVTLCAVQLATARVPLQPLTRYVHRRLQTVRERIPDADKRQAFARTGLTITGCEQADTAIDTLLRDYRELLAPGAEAQLRAWLLVVAAGVEEMTRSCKRYHVTAEAVPALAAAWIGGNSIAALRAAHAPALGVDDVIRFSSVLDGVVSHDLAWVLSSLLALLAARLEGTWEPTPELAALPAMAAAGPRCRAGQPTGGPGAASPRLRGAALTPARHGLPGPLVPCRPAAHRQPAGAGAGAHQPPRPQRHPRARQLRRGARLRRPRGGPQHRAPAGPRRDRRGAGPGTAGDA